MSFRFDPMPHTEARDRIASLPLVSRDVMDQLLPELRPYAFCITGLDVGDQMARVRDMIVAVPAGEKTWDKAKREIAGELTEALSGKEAERRAELLLRTHTFRGYAASRYRTLMAQIAVFPWWQYKTHGDGNVRPSHAALNGKIFPAGHPIWQMIFPPWDWGCRCLVVPLTDRAVRALRAAGMKPQDDDGTLQRSQIVRPEIFDVRQADSIAKVQRLPSGVSLNASQTWSQSPWSEPGTVRHTWGLVQQRYADQPEVLAAFRQWAGKTEIQKGMTVAEWLGDAPLPGTKPRIARRAKKTAKAAVPSGSDPRAAVVEALTSAGIDPDKAITFNQAKALIEELKELDPVKASTKIASIREVKSKVLTKAWIEKEVQNFINFLPPEVVQQLPDLRISPRPSKSWKGQYSQGGHVSLSTTWLKSAAEARSTLYHELGHWVHMELPGKHRWVKAIKAHFEKRTAGEQIQKLEGYASTGLRDKWWEAYMGRVYRTPKEITHMGLEFPTRNFELLSDPARLSTVWSHSAEAREDIQLALEGLFP